MIANGMISGIHPSRVRWLHSGAPAPGARYVLYWIQINQRAHANDALDFAIEQANALDLPVVAYQGLRPDYPGANDRLHTFVLEGAFDLRGTLAARKILHLFHLERRPAAASGLLAALARHAALVVTDHYPVFIVNGQARALARAIERPVAAVEASCIVPAALFPKTEFAARTLRPKIHALLPEHLVPREDARVKRSSLAMGVPFPFPGEGLEAEERSWLDLADETGDGDGEDVSRTQVTGKSARNERARAAARTARRDRIREWVASCAIDHRIAPSPVYRGGELTARARLRAFVADRLARYPEARNDPSVEGTSGLSPYLHFGQIAPLEVALTALGFPSLGGTVPESDAGVKAAAKSGVKAVAGSPSTAVTAKEHEAGESHRAAVVPGTADSRHTVASVPEIGAALQRALAERETAIGAFIEQLVVRRELAFNYCETNPRHASIEGLPDWARRTLDDHAADPKKERYDAGALEWAETADDVWNAAQHELRETGVIHNRLRMLWGKKIIEWSDTPAEAMRIMIDLHERYALDGRDANTYASVLWCLGLHDRPFGPARPVLGTVRPMSTAVARKKMDIPAYVARVRRASEPTLF
jgi:deoxyribodipyrimidine photo-lyase